MISFRRHALNLLASAMLLMALPFSAEASFPASPWTEQTAYFDKISHKLGFGLLNATTGWFDLFNEPIRGPLAQGLLRAPFKAVSNTAGGLIHIATFPLPVDVPLWDGGIQFEESAGT